MFADMEGHEEKEPGMVKVRDGENEREVTSLKEVNLCGILNLLS